MAAPEVPDHTQRKQMAGSIRTCKGLGEFEINDWPGKEFGRKGIAKPRGVEVEKWSLALK